MGDSKKDLRKLLEAAEADFHSMCEKYEVAVRRIAVLERELASRAVRRAEAVS